MSLLNFDNIPGGEISGLDSEMLDWVSNESGYRNLWELTSSCMEMLNDVEISEPELSDDVILELDLLEKAAVPNSSLKQMETTMKRFKNFLESKKLSSNITSIPPTILNTYLRYFYSELRQQNGSFYSPASLICFRAAIHRYFCLHKPEINIIGDPQFNQCNRMLKTMVSKFKTSGQAKTVQSFPIIESDDMTKIRNYFDRSSPEILQEEIMFNLIYFLGFRGRETLPQLTKNSFALETSSTGKSFLCINTEILSKNAKASLRQKEYEEMKKARMYEISDNPNECPIRAWNMYMEMIEDSTFLFPKPSKMKSKRPKSCFTPNTKVGKCTIDNLMSNLSSKCNLSRRYTNHSIRVTLITILKEGGFSNTDISAITGHKNPMSVERYNRKRRDQDFESMAEVAHVGTSSKIVAVEKVSKRARIVVAATENSSSTSSFQSDSAIKIYFNGSFHGCDINIMK